MSFPRRRELPWHIRDKTVNPKPNNTALTSKFNKAQQGFTLVELVIIVVLLSIIAIVAVPRFTGNTGFTEYAMQKRLLGALRNLQLKAVYDTRANVCYKMILDTGSSPEFGPTTDSYLSGQEATSCASSIDYEADAFTRSDLDEIANDGLSFSAIDTAQTISFVQFDNIGRVSTSEGNCASTCTLSFSGENVASICISSEGYIHAC